MSGTGSPCGACKFLRRKCVKGCVFAPYFCHEQGATHFGAIHKVFGASNVSKLLSHLPLNERSEAALTISYEAHARLQDPIYGCVSHIFALQQQVVNLQGQLANLRQVAAQNMLNGSNNNTYGQTQNPNDRSNGYNNLKSSTSNYPQDVQSWLQSNYPSMLPPLDQSPNNNTQNSWDYGSDQGYDFLNNNHEHSFMAKASHDHGSLASFEGSSSRYSMGSIKFENNSEWIADDLHSVAFGYSQHSA